MANAVVGRRRGQGAEDARGFRRDDPDRPSAFDYEWEEQVWKDVKAWFLENVFHYKCAYCESPLELDRYYGDAEHFRPKGNVTVASALGPKRRAKSTLDGAPIDHPAV